MTKKYPEPQPKGLMTDKMCDQCPFRPDGSGYAVHHPDYEKFQTIAKVGLPFYCHETVILDPRTKLNKQVPDPIPQEHFRICRGSHELRLKVWQENIEKMEQTNDNLRRD